MGIPRVFQVHVTLEHGRTPTADPPATTTRSPLSGPRRGTLHDVSRHHGCAGGREPPRVQVVLFQARSRAVASISSSPHGCRDAAVIRWPTGPARQRTRRTAGRKRSASIVDDLQQELRADGGVPAPSGRRSRPCGPRGGWRVRGSRSAVWTADAAPDAVALQVVARAPRLHRALMLRRLFVRP